MKIKITPDKERAKSVLKMVKDRETFLESTEKLNTTIAAENYYEIMKELSTALAFIEGFKFIGNNAHKMLFNFIGEYDEITEFERFIIQDLRERRNKSSYEGKPIERIYLENNKIQLLEIIKKLKLLIHNRLKE